MVGKWKVTSQYFGEKRVFAAYRLLDTAEPDHSGNREFATDYIEDRQEVADICERLNEEGEARP